MPDSKTGVKVSEILIEDYMKPNGISAYKLAKAINVPTSRIQNILNDRRTISADTSVRLGRYFGLPDDYFISIQIKTEIQTISIKNENEIESIISYNSVE